MRAAPMKAGPAQDPRRKAQETTIVATPPETSPLVFERSCKPMPAGVA